MNTENSILLSLLAHVESDVGEYSKIGTNIVEGIFPLSDEQKAKGKAYDAHFRAQYKWLADCVTTLKEYLTTPGNATDALHAVNSLIDHYTGCLEADRVRYLKIAHSPGIHIFTLPQAVLSRNIGFYAQVPLYEDLVCIRKYIYEHM